MTQQQTEQHFASYPGQNGPGQPEPEPEAVEGVVEDPFEGMIDSYSFGGTQDYTLPDGKQTITFKVLNEGEKARYQKLTNRDIKINRKTDEAAFKPDAAADRHALILTAVVGWELFSRNPSTHKWEKLIYSEAMLKTWLQITDPRLVEGLERAIRKANPWLSAEDATVEELEEAITDLNEQLIEARKREMGKAL